MKDRDKSLLEGIVGGILWILVVATSFWLLDTDGTIVGHGWDALIGLGVGIVDVLIGGAIHLFLTIRRLQRENDATFGPIIAYWRTSTWCDGCKMPHVSSPCRPINLGGTA